MLKRYAFCILASAVSHWYVMKSAKVKLPRFAAESQAGLLLHIFCWAYAFTYAVSPHKGNGDKSSWFQHLGMWGRWVRRNIKSATVTAEVPLDHEKQYIFASFPHGAVSANHILSMTDAAGFLSKVYKGDRRDLAASILFYIPVVREILLALGNVDAGANTAKKQLQKKRSLLIFVGGEKEQLMTEPNSHKIYCRSRFGFVKLALQHGVELVPMYTFGENEIYHISHAFHDIRHWLQRNLSIGISLFYGRGLLCMKPLEGVDLAMEIGPPVPLPKKFKNNAKGGVDAIDPSREDIESYHAAFIAAQSSLFEKTKGKHGVAADVKLEIL